ncbi:MAG: EF-hand domain-containing protein [Desulfovibrionales bacterium]
MKIFITLWICMGLFLFAGSAQAQDELGYAEEEPAPLLTEEEFDELDVNNDGVLSYQEYEDAAREEFDAMDVDKSGDLNWKEDQMKARFGTEFPPGAGDEEISKEYLEQEEPETVAGAGTLTEERFDELDTDNDGNVSWSEYQESVRSEYEGMDADKSGNVNWVDDDMEQRFGTKREPSTEQMEYQGQDQDVQLENQPGVFGGQEAAAGEQAYTFEEFDMDSDANVSWYEYQSNMAGANSEDFRMLDEDQDGVLSRDEFQSEQVRMLAGEQPGADVEEQPGVTEMEGVEEPEAGTQEPGVAWTGAQTEMEEREVLGPEYVVESFNIIDINDDGRISESEYQEGLREYFDEIDTDRSGDLNWKEDQMEARFGVEFPPGAGDEEISQEYLEQDEPETVAEAGRYLIPEQKFEELDVDGDGILTYQEFESGAPDFNELDRDNDGYLTRDEF